MNNILIIEDEVSHSELIRRAFESQDRPYDLTIVHTLAAARQHIAEDDLHMALVDILLPDGKGIELLETSELTKKCPVVVMTSHGDEQMAVAAMKAGAFDYVVKSTDMFAESPRIAERTLREWGHIQARRQAEIETNRTAAELRAFIESAAQGVLVVDQDRRILLVNRQLELQFGYSRDELLGQPMEMLLLVEAGDRLNTDLPEYLADPTKNVFGRDGEFYGVRKNSTQFPIEVSLSHVESDGQLRIMCLISDITERKRLQAETLRAQKIQSELEYEREQRAYRERFVSMVSHEFRSPLAAILTSTYMLKTYYQKLTEDKREGYFQKIEAKVRELDEMVERILILSKSSMGKIDCVPQSVDMLQFCAAILDDVRKATATDRIVLTTVLETPTATFDPDLMQHVVSNLLGNALKYSSDKSPVNFHIINNQDGCTFEVTDQGIGIPQEDLAKIFEPFHRASNVGHAPGSGVGLAVVKEFVEAQGATLTITSELDKGTTFTVTLATT